MKNSELPESWVNVMVTYKKIISFGPYGDQKRKEIVTKMGFYSDLFGDFSIPPEWRNFTMGGKNVLLPHGWGGDRLTPEEVIEWKPLEKIS